MRADRRAAVEVRLVDAGERHLEQYPARAGRPVRDDVELRGGEPGRGGRVDLAARLETDVDPGIVERRLQLPHARGDREEVVLEPRVTDVRRDRRIVHAVLGEARGVGEAG